MNEVHGVPPALGLQSVIEATGAVCIRGMEPTRDGLVALGRYLGCLVPPGTAMRNDLHDGEVYTVAVRNDGAGMADEYGNVIVSTTTLPFSLHTDGYNSPLPPHYVALLCSDTGDSVVPTTLVDSLPVLAAMKPELRSALARNAFPTAMGPRPLLFSTGSGGFGLRLNREEIDRWLLRSSTNLLPAECEAALAELEEGLLRAQESVALERGDCVVFDNWRVCHGRGAVPASSTRSLLRVWVADKEHPNSKR